MEEVGFTLQGIHQLFHQSHLSPRVLANVAARLLITLICAVIAYPASFIIARAPTRYRTLAMSLVILPLMTNAVARTYAWLIILGRNGFLNKLFQWTRITDQPIRLIFTEQAIVLGLAQLFLPLMVLPLVSSMENIPEDVIEAARSLGANQFTTFVRVICLCPPMACFRRNARVYRLSDGICNASYFGRLAHAAVINAAVSAGGHAGGH